MPEDYELPQPMEGCHANADAVEEAIREVDSPCCVSTGLNLAYNPDSFGSDFERQFMGLLCPEAGAVGDVARAVVVAANRALKDKESEIQYWQRRADHDGRELDRVLRQRYALVKALKEVRGKEDRKDYRVLALEAKARHMLLSLETLSKDEIKTNLEHMLLEAK